MTNRCLLGAGVAVAVAFGGAQAHAQLLPWNQTGVPGAFYVGPEGGWTALTNQTDSTNGRSINAPGLGFVGTLPSRSLAANYNGGFNVGGRVGYQWGPWRLEEEYSYRHSSLSSFSGLRGGFGFTTNNVTGQRLSDAIMTNVIYDFTIGWPVSPHLGCRHHRQRDAQ
jgi:hypothetical protein